jgi:hypothetical protein
MTNSIAISTGAVIVIALIADQYFLDGAGALLGARKFTQLVEWLAFWR